MEPWNLGTWNPGTLKPPWILGTLLAVEAWNPGTLEPLNLGTLGAGNLGRWIYCAFLSRDSCYAMTAKPLHKAEKL